MSQRLTNVRRVFSLRRLLLNFSTGFSRKFVVIQHLARLTGRLFDLVNSVDVYEKLGGHCSNLSCHLKLQLGISVMDELIELKVEGSETLLGRFAHYLRVLFQQSSNTEEDSAVLVNASFPLPQTQLTRCPLAHRPSNSQNRHNKMWLFIKGVGFRRLYFPFWEHLSF